MRIPEDEIIIDDHLARNEESVCGYCGHAFAGYESRIEKFLYGRKWVFCSEECLINFKDASNCVETEQDPDDVKITSGDLSKFKNQ